MASANIETSLDANDDNHQAVKRRESKKRKFRPFSAVRKLFGGGKNKRKASGDEENQGASATKDRPTSAPVFDSPGQDRLGNKRHASADYDGGVSEGSVMSPDRKEAATVLTQSALSDTNVPKSAFQAELAGKLNKRRSFCSEEDEEDGLRQGLTPPVLATDDSTEDSGQEDLFHSRWSSAIPSSPVSVSGTATVPESHVPHGSVDLSTMGRTELLRSDAAKDRISVKPRTRKSQSRKTRQGRYSLSLPSLVEVDSGAGGGGGGGGQTPHPGGRPRSEYIDPSVLSDFDLTTIPSALSAVELTSPQREKTTSPTQRLPSINPTPTPTTDHQDSVGILNIRSQATPTSPPAKTHRVSFATDSERASSSKTVTKAVASSPVVKLQDEKDDVILNLSESSDLKTTDSPEKAVTNGELDADTKPGLSSVPESSSLSGDRKKEGLRQTDRETEDAFAPKPDYKIRRQQRSKTLPVQQSVITVQRTASQRDGASSGHVQNSPEKQEPTSKGDEPAWIALARRKTQRHNEESSSSSVDEAAPRKQSLEIGPSATITITKKSAASRSVAASASMSSSVLSEVNTESKTSQSNEIHTRRWQSTKTLPTYLSRSAATAASTITSTSTAPKTTPSLIRVASPQSSATVIKIENTPALSTPPQASSSISTKLETTRPIHSSKSNSLPRPRSRVEKAFTAPHWQTELIQRTLDSGDVKIELIESKSSSPDSKTSGKKEAESSSQQQSDSKVGEMTTDGQTDQCRTSLANKRHSRVMDLLKNFENLQSVS